MPSPSASDRAPPASNLGPLIGVVDVGSNSVRLVVFCGPPRAPTPVFNEKVLCGLGRKLTRTGRLDEQGMALAMLTLRRFASLARRMGVGALQVVATAAIREAENGPAFVAELEQTCGVAISILSGEEEARYSALGVISGMPEADGLIGDLGGGSLELVRVERGAVLESVTLPLGPFRLASIAGDRLKEHVDGLFKGVPWLGRTRGKPYFLVGGAWRAIARIHMAKTAYSLRIIHNYRMPGREAEDVARLLSRQSRDSLVRLEAVPRRRLDTLPLAALVMRRLIKAGQPSELVFSALGLREGLHFATLSEAERREDPLIAACRDMAARESRFAEHGDELAEFSASLFAGESATEKRLRLAACLLSDVGWRINPDYRGEQAFRRVLRAPFVGIDHPGRAFVALTVFARYQGDIAGDATLPGRQLIDDQTARRALTLGLGLRLAHTLSGGTPGLLQDFRLRLQERTLCLDVPASAEALLGEVAERRLEALAASRGLAHEIRINRRR